jgi:hypothetical protein
MVRAILEDRKSMTRRVVKFLENSESWSLYFAFEEIECNGHPLREYLLGECPYGIPGDRLWVRETLMRPPGTSIAYYAADNVSTGKNGNWSIKRNKKPSIFMDRLYSRITLEITDVRVERLQEITEEDAEREGAPRYNPCPTLYPFGYKGEYRNGFMRLWDSINGRSFLWASNPWCWPISFRRV